MKKITLLAAVISIASFASCKKAYKCECTTTLTSSTYNGSAQTGQTKTTVTNREISKTSKKNAEALCGNGTDTQTTSNSYGTTVENSNTTCALK